jgi:hypothetical protein
METEERQVMRWMIILQEREEVMRWRIERNEGWRGGEDDWEEGRREVVRMTERKEGDR